MNSRIKEIRKKEKLSQQKFADELGIARGNIAAYEVGKNSPSDAVISLICTKFNINREWILNGNGDMYNLIEDETAAIVSDLLEESNPMYDIIKGIMKTYRKLDKQSQQVIDDFSLELLNELKKGG
jgi:Predicted transcriptional regulator